MNLYIYSVQLHCSCSVVCPLVLSFFRHKKYKFISQLVSQFLLQIYEFAESVKQRKSSGVWKCERQI